MSISSIRATVLPNLLEAIPAGLKYLSLDCFDTLLWRNTHAPHDLFADLPIAGGATEPRKWAELQARISSPYLNNRHEVTIDEIHAQLLPNGSVEDQAALVQAELDAEARHCFAFAPTRDLMVDAKRRGLKIVVVSDTYLSEPRLRALIAQVGGQDLADMIDNVFCSCEYGVSKAGGLFQFVLDGLGIAPREMLHVGDNPIADLVAARKMGIPSLHLQQFDGQAHQRLRMEAAAASMIEPSSRVSAPVYQPHRAQIAQRVNEDATYAFGHDVLGPMMHGFVSWLRSEAEQMEAATGKRVKLLFLQRDGHLPARAFQALYPEWADRVAEVAISRFVAINAGFRTEEDIRRHMAPWLTPSSKKSVDKLHLFARQLMFDKQETDAFVESGFENFGGLIMTPENIEKILTRARAASERMYRHLRSCGVEDGDAVILVDLGYNGSVQNSVEAVLRADMGLEVAGRYFLLREWVPSGLDKKGYFDTRNYDYNMLTTVFISISVVEQFCTMTAGSVVGYEEDGTPLRENSSVKSAQSDCRAQAQDACLDFVRGMDAGFVRRPQSDDNDSRRQAAMAVLGRLLFMPIPEEVEMLKNFSHDANFGTRGLIQMSDLDSADRSIRRRGFFYTRNAMRMYLPGELQQFGLPMNLSMFSIRRFNLDFAKGDIDTDALQLPIQIFRDGESSAQSVGAHRTADGYYRATVPVGKGEFTVGIFLGRLFQYVQFEEISVQPVKALTREEVTPAPAIIEAMDEIAPRLYRTDGPHGFMIVPAIPSEEPMLLNLIFRPIIMQEQVEQERQAA